jgi:uncharacterized protein (TIGR00725 family)
MRISIFGGSHPQPGDIAYENALQLGKMLAERGHTILTGGYVGTMEAVSRGAVEAGGHVIGVTCDEIESWRSLEPNAWITEEKHERTLIDRLSTLIQECDLAIALPGGVGTLAEIAITWNQIILNVIKTPKVILVGPEWRKVMESLFNTLGIYIPEIIREYIIYSNTITNTISLVDKFSSEVLKKINTECGHEHR